jgi:GT2 family glycosyltransferase
MHPLVSIIIPCFNKWELTRNCLDHLEQTTTDVEYEVILIDNGSTDATEAESKKLTNPRFFVARNNTNLNFSGGCNQGARRARGEFLHFLNNDTTPLDGWLSAMLQDITDYGSAIVGSKLLYPNGTIQHAGVAFTREVQFPYHPYKRLPGKHPFVNHRRELQCVTGASLLIRGDTFEKLGGFDEAYVNGGEDIDLCVRCFRAGGLVAYQPKSQLIHLESQSPGRMDNNTKNCTRFCNQYRTVYLADEDLYYYQDYQHRTETRATYDFSTNTAQCQSPREREVWMRVAQVQHRLLLRKFPEADRMLEDTGVWPADYLVRRWAGLLAMRRGLHKAASEHFVAMLEHETLRAIQQLKNDQNTMLVNYPRLLCSSLSYE